MSVTERMTADCLQDSNQLTAIGKGGRRETFMISPDLHRALRLFLTHRPGPLVDRRGYQSAYRRAIEAAGGRVTGTHGARRRSIRDYYSVQYREAVNSGISPAEAAEQAAGDAIQRLGHGRDRRELRRVYLGAA